MPSEQDVWFDVPPGFDRLDEAARMILPDLGEVMRAAITTRANQELRSSSQDYLQGLQAPTLSEDEGDPVVSLQLVGWLPTAIEKGWAGGDMKPWLLNGPNSRPIAGGGRMNIIPFRHGTPGTTGRNFPPMGSQYTSRTVGAHPQMQAGTMTRNAAARLGNQVYARARNLKPTVGHPEGGTKWGDRLPAGLAPKLKERHATDIFAGMVREVKVYESAEQSQYMTFRAVSSNSDPQSWIHPGIPRHAFFEKAAPEVAEAAEKLLVIAISRLSGGTT